MFNCIFTLCHPCHSSFHPFTPYYFFVFFLLTECTSCSDAFAGGERIRGNERSNPFTHPWYPWVVVGGARVCGKDVFTTWSESGITVDRFVDKIRVVRSLGNVSEGNPIQPFLPLQALYPPFPSKSMTPLPLRTTNFITMECPFLNYSLLSETLSNDHFDIP